MKKHLLFFLIVLNTVSKAQQPVFRNYTVNDGLPSSEVYHAFQDSRGFLWFSTDRGVCRFDGTNFKTYTTIDGLADNTVFETVEDGKRRLWFRSFSGRISFLLNDSIYQVKNNDYIQALLGGSIINSLYVTPDDELILGAEESFIFRLRLNNDLSCSLIEKINCNVFDDPLTDLEIDGLSGRDPVSDLIRVRIKGKELQLKVQKNLSGTNSQIRCILLKDRSYLLSKNTTLIRFNENGIISSRTFENQIIYLSQASSGEIFISFYKGGIWKFSSSELMEKPEARYFGKASASSTLIDKNKGLWVTTLEKGVFFLQSDAFYHYPDLEKFDDPKIVFVGGDLKADKELKSREKIFIGLQDGTVLVSKDRTFTPFFKHKRNPYGSAISLFTSSLNEKWFAFSTGTLILSHDGSYEWKPWVCNGFSESFDSTIYAVAYSLVYKIRNKALLDKYIKNAPLNFRGITAWNNRLWISTLNGLWSFNNGSFTFEGNSSPYLKQRITDLKVDKDNRLWLSSLGAGVIVKTKDSLYHIGADKGILSNLCNSLFIDDENSVWVSTNSGLSRIRFPKKSLKEYSIENYTVNNGLVSNEINNVFRKDDSLFVATNKGLSLIILSRLKPDTASPPVYFTGFRVNNKDTNLFSEYKLKYIQNNLGISFVGISYSSGKNTLYRYQLKSASQEQPLFQYTNRNTLQLSSLMPGKYEFLVWAGNANGVWSETPAILQFTISPPFWATWWFRFLLAATSAFLIYYLVRLRFKHVLAKNQLITELNLTKQKAFAAQMEPHFIFNSLNSIQNYILQNNRIDSSKYLSKFSRLMRLILDNSKQVYVSLENELNALRLYVELEALRFKDQIEYSINVDPEVDLIQFKVPSLIIQPYVENAIWHGLMHKESGKGKLEIDLDMINGRLVCTITDNGIGRARSKEINSKTLLKQSSDGMALTQKRVDLTNSIYKQKMKVTITDLKDENNQATGTKVQLIFSSF